MFNSLHEECGVFGIFENKTTYVAQSAYLALYALQHRGQESCGIAVNDDGVFRHHRGDGLVPDVFTSDKLDALGTGNMAIGHVRYSTTGGKNVNNIQPLVIRHIKFKGLSQIRCINKIAVMRNSEITLNMAEFFTARQIPSLLLILLFQPVLQVRALRRLLKR